MRHNEYILYTHTQKVTYAIDMYVIDTITPTHTNSPDHIQ